MKKALKRMTLHNFQSHSHTVIDLSPQINIIVGPSDVGKTAIVRALRWLFYNQPRGSSFLRVGTNECWVEVETEDGTRVRRYRHEGQKRNGYIVEKPGKEPIIFERIGNSVPLEVKEALGIRELLIDQDIPLELNIAQQLDGPFLLNHSPSVRAKAIGRLGETHVIDAAQREIQKDLRTLVMLSGKLEAEIQITENQLEQYHYLDEWKSALDSLEAIWERYDKLKIKLETISQIAAEYQKKKARLGEIEQVLAQLDNLALAEEKRMLLDDRLSMLAEMDYLFSQWFEKKATLVQNEKTLTITNRLDGIDEKLETISVLGQRAQELMAIKAKYRTLAEAIKDNEHIIDSSKGLSAAEKILEKLIELRTEGIETSRQLKELKSLNQRRIERQNELKKLKTRLASLTETLRAETLLDEVKSLLVTADRLTTVADERSHKIKSLAARQKELDELYQEYQQLGREYLATLQEMGCCPVCQGTIDEVHLAKIAEQLKGDWEFEQQAASNDLRGKD